MSLIKLIIVKINPHLNFKKYLYLFPENIQAKILGYKFKKNQVTSFTSELLKYYYLPISFGLNPKDISIVYTKYGRPYLIDNPLNIDFNISHSGDYVSMAIVQHAQVGIDIEQINYDIEPKELASIAFSEIEQKVVGDNIKQFFEVWTKKEALLKLSGTGFGTNDYLNTNVINNSFSSQFLIYSEYIFNSYYLSLCLLPDIYKSVR